MIFRVPTAGEELGLAEIIVRRPSIRPKASDMAATG
jgi:hypothetical protein